MGHRDEVVGHANFAVEVASQLARLMACKDEYEVARLHADSGVLASIRAQFAGDLQLDYHLAPPSTLSAARTSAAWNGDCLLTTAALPF